MEKRYHMNRIYIATAAMVCLLGTFNQSYAGNSKRVGSAGASELLINPWARSTGWGGLHTAGVRGLEAMNSNVGGLAFTEGTEIIFSHTNYMAGSGIAINAFGFAQRIGKAGVLGVSVMSMDFGDIKVTTELFPDGTLGTYSPQFLNMGVGYSHTFSKSIHGGFVLRGISESVANVSALGFAIDGGIQYVAGKRDQIKFGVAIRNQGTSMNFGGDALSVKATNSNTGYVQTLNTPSQEFELPSLLNIGASYDFKLSEGHRFTLASNFTSNSFTQDLVGIGGEYAFKDFFMLRAGYNNQKGLFDYNKRLTAYTGGSMGATFQFPLGANGTKLALDYSFVGAYVYQGNHSIGVKLTL